MAKKCPDCGRSFTPKRVSRIYCYDKECFKARHRRQNGGKAEAEPYRRCIICNKEYTPKSTIQKTCGSEWCKAENSRIRSRNYNRKKRRERGASERISPLKIRPYTHDDTMCIVISLLEGQKPKEMAKVYNRDVEDLRKYIAKIRRDGTFSKHEKALKIYREHNKPMTEIGVESRTGILI